MDRATHLQDAIGMIEESFIAEISQYYQKRITIRKKRIRRLFVAACIVLLFVLEGVGIWRSTDLFSHRNAIELPVDSDSILWAEKPLEIFTDRYYPYGPPEWNEWIVSPELQAALQNTNEQTHLAILVTKGESLQSNYVLFCDAGIYSLIIQEQLYLITTKSELANIANVQRSKYKLFLAPEYIFETNGTPAWRLNETITGFNTAIMTFGTQSKAHQHPIDDYDVIDSLKQMANEWYYASDEMLIYIISQEELPNKVLRSLNGELTSKRNLDDNHTEYQLYVKYEDINTKALRNLSVQSRVIELRFVPGR
ncbi:MAG: hypothetical protein IJW97_07660 [Clostridia bacterium]|nr:hypothetical protein [Clostridia bacterium]